MGVHSLESKLTHRDHGLLCRKVSSAHAYSMMRKAIQCRSLSLSDCAIVSRIILNRVMAKKTTLEELGEMLRLLIKHSADYTTKEDLTDGLTSLEGRLIDKIEGVEANLTVKIEGVDNKLNGTNSRLDEGAMQRTEEKLPQRLADVEVEVFGASRAPRLSR